MQNNSLYKYKVILVALVSSLVITGVGFIDNYITNIILAGIGTLAYAIVGVLYSLNLIHGKNAGKEAFIAISIILLLVGLAVYNGFIAFTHWLASWPLWGKILVPSLLVLAIIVTLIMRYNMKLFKRIIKSKYLYISLAIIVGLLLTILFSQKNYNIDILFGVGSGIFGSALVTLLIEILSDIRDNKKISRQRKFVFADIKADIWLLLEYELSNFSSYCSLYSEEEKLTKKEETIKNVLELLKDYGDKIKNYIVEDYKINGITIAEDDYRVVKGKYKYLCSDALPYYERLLKNTLKIVEDKDFYLNMQVINEKEYDEINSLRSLLHYVVAFSGSESRDRREATIEMKEQFFEQLPNIFSLLKIDINQQIKIRF